VPAILLAVVVAACGGPSSSSPSSAASVPAGGDSAGRDAYTTAICPILVDITELDPRLVALRSAGDAGGDVRALEGEAGDVASALNVLLTDLDAVPEWAAGDNLRFQLTTALHGIRARILAIDFGSPAAAEDLAELPFVASEAVDRAMAQAVASGFGMTCLDPS
jgi:hypothetical protein